MIRKQDAPCPEHSTWWRRSVSSDKENPRVYVKAISYTGSVLAPRQGFVTRYHVSGTTEVKKFGRYRIEKDESVTVAMDDGEKAALKLIDGRRNLTWGKTTYGNALWELEALKRAEKQKR
jgi:hypothetical protein